MQAPLAAAFLIGLLGGVHCVGMCGGIVGAPAANLPQRQRAWDLHLAYGVGRITSYAVAGLVRAAALGEHIRQGLLCII